MATALHPSPKPPQLGLFFPSTTNFFSPILPSLHHRHRHHRSRKSSIPKIPLSSSFRNGSNTPSETGCPVPQDQQPINEYQTLSTSFPFSWAAGDFVEYGSRLFVTGASFALFIGLPVACFGALGPDQEPFKRIICSVSSGVFVVTLAVVRMYLGWAYVGNRLLSATVECKCSGLLFVLCYVVLTSFDWLLRKLRKSEELEILNFGFLFFCFKLFKTDALQVGKLFVSYDVLLRC